MSRSKQADFDLPQQVTCGITDEDRKQEWFEIKQQLADSREVNIEKVSHADVARELIDEYSPDLDRDYRQIKRLRDDKRVRESIEAIASDHNCDPSDVSLECALRTAGAAYLGYQTTEDWQFDDE